MLVAVAAPVNIRHAFATQTKQRVGLRARRNFEPRDTAQRRHIDLAAHRGHRKTDRHFAKQIIAVTLEQVMWPNVDYDVEIAGRAGAHAGFAVTGTAQSRTVLDAGGNPDFQFGAILNAAFAAAAFAGMAKNLAGTVAAWARGRDREKSARMGDLALSVTGWAGFGLGALGCPAAFAFGTGIQLGKSDFPLDSTSGVFEFDLQIITQIVAALCATARRLPAAAAECLFDKIFEDAAASTSEHFTEDLEWIMEPASRVPGTSSAAGGECGVAKAVIGGALLGIAERLIRFADFLEFLLGLFVAGVLVGMIFQREFALSLLHLLVRSFPRNTEHFVVIALGHSGDSDSGLEVSGVSAAGGPLLTTTRAGRSRRSASLYPRCSCSTTWPSGCSADVA